jgi:hypothetical protein
VYFGKIEDLAAAAQGAHQPPHPRQTVVAALWAVTERLARASLYPSCACGASDAATASSAHPRAGCGCGEPDWVGGLN